MKYRYLGMILALLGAGLYFGAELYLFERPAFPLDDSWIHLQFADRLASGDGLTYNAGERVNGSTSPLWTALLSLGFLLPGGIPLLWPKILGIFLLMTSVRAIGKLAGMLGLSPWSQCLAQILLATTPWWLWSSLSGMEILLFGTLALYGLVDHQRELDEPGRPPWSLFWLSIACLARPEGLLILAAALFERLIERPIPRKSLFKGASVSAIILIPITAYYTAVAGSPLPSTFQAKTHSDRDLLPDTAYLWKALHILWDAQPVLTLCALGGGLALLASRGSKRPLRLLPLLWLAGQPLAYAVITSGQGPQPLGNFGRYYFPLLPIVIVLGLKALEPLYRTPPFRLGPFRLSLSVAIAGLLLVPQTFSFLKGPGRYLQTVANVEDSDVRMALWLRDRLPPGARLAAQDIGALKFFLPDHYLVDLAGIVTPETRAILHRSLTEPDAGYWENDLAKFLEQARVDYLVLFSSSYPGISRPGSGFKRLHELKIERNVTMAGHELVVLKAPWSGAPDLSDP